MTDEHIIENTKTDWNDYVNSILREYRKCSHGSYMAESLLLFKKSIPKCPN
jgi:hypothetical protein